MANTSLFDLPKFIHSHFCDSLTASESKEDECDASAIESKSEHMAEAMGRKRKADNPFTQMLQLCMATLKCVNDIDSGSQQSYEILESQKLKELQMNARLLISFVCESVTLLTDGGSADALELIPRIDWTWILPLVKSLDSGKALKGSALATKCEAAMQNAMAIENTAEFVALKRALDKTNWDYVAALIQEFRDNDKLDAVVSEMHAKDITALAGFVRSKMNHKKHVEMGNPLTFEEMMAVVLYSVCVGVSDLNAAIRKEEYEVNPWPIWKTTLRSALLKLEKRQRRKCKVYCGVSGVRLPEDVSNAMHLPAFVNTSLNKELALAFLCGDGTLLEFDIPPTAAPSFGADVSWISWFPEEKEVMFIPGNGNAKLEVIGIRDGVEHIRVHPFSAERCPIDVFL